jgi:hypothetical protein
MDSSNKISPFAGMAIILVTALLVRVIYNKAQSPLMWSLIAGAIAGILTLLVFQVAKEIRKRKKKNKTPPTEGK